MIRFDPTFPNLQLSRLSTFNVKIFVVASSTRVYAQTHVFKVSVYKGSQWAILNASVIDSPVYNGYIVTYPSIWVSTLDRL